jgi:hypothetical protein
MRCRFAPEHFCDAAVTLQTKRECSGAIMANQREIDRRNDTRLLTPLLVMALVIAAGVLIYALSAHAMAAL